MSWYQKIQVMISKGTIVLFSALCGATLLGLAGLWLVEQELVARAGEGLALAATGIADKLDAMLRERDGDIEIIAAAPQVRGTDAAQVTRHLRAVQAAYPVYSRLAVTNQAGRVVASTDENWVGKDFHHVSWYQAVQQAPRVYAETVRAPDEPAGQLMGVVFSAPISDTNGTFLGVVMTEVDRTIWIGLVEESVNQFSARTESFGIVRYRVLGHDGALLLTLEQEDQPSFNLLDMGLPSAAKVATGRSGYVEEEHLVNKVPVVTGYARMSGVRSLVSLKWGLLVRAERADVLASVRRVLLKIGFIGVVGFLLMLAAVFSANVAQRNERERSKRAELAHRESEMRAKCVIESALDAVVIMDANGHIIEWNRPAEQTFGWSREEALGRALGETIVPPSFREAHVQGIRKYLATGEGPILNQRIEIAAIRKNGSEFPVELTITPLGLENGTIFSAFVRDITDRKKMVERLRESETFFKLLSDQLPVGVFEISEDGKCLYKNKMWDTIMRRTNEDVFGFSSVSLPDGLWLDWFHPDDRRKLVEDWTAAKTSFTRLLAEYRLATGDEETRWVEVAIWPMADDRGFRFLGMVEDITARKKTIADTMQLMHHGRFELKTLAEARHLAELLAYAFPDPSRAQLGLTELLVNGVEHGNLGISYAEKSAFLDQGQFETELIRRSALPELRNKRVHITVERTDRNLVMTIRDDGSGFDWKQYLDLNHAGADESHGRGIGMAKAMSFDRLEFQGCGNQVVVSVSLKGIDTDSWQREERKVA